MAALGRIFDGLARRGFNAEFVENLEMLAALREINVDFAQGYGISRPRLLESLKPEPASRYGRGPGSSDLISGVVPSP